MSEEVTKSQGNNKFLKGTLILTISSIVVKVIGALNWVILSRIMGGEGIGLYQMGFPIYLMAITVSSAGIPVAISIITAEKVAMEDYGGAQRVFHVSLKMLFCTGLLFPCSLWCWPTGLWKRSFLMHVPIIPSSPWLRPFFRYVSRQFPRLFPGLADHDADRLLGNHGTGCTGWNHDCLFCPALALRSYLRRCRRQHGGGSRRFLRAPCFDGLLSKAQEEVFPKGVDRTPKTQESAGYIMKRLIALALPVSMSSLMLPIVSNLDMMIVPTRLKIGGWDAPGEDNRPFGYLSGMAVPLINMSTILTAALSISLVPAISESRTLSDEAGIRSKVATAFTVASVITIPCSVGLHVLGGRVAALIYNAPAAGPAIEIMSWAIFLLGLHQVSTGILQGLGKTRIPVINMIIAAIVKVFLNWNLTAMPTLGIKGSSWATVADIGIAALLNLFSLRSIQPLPLKGGSFLRLPFVQRSWEAL